LIQSTGRFLLGEAKLANAFVKPYSVSAFAPFEYFCG